MRVPSSRGERSARCGAGGRPCGRQDSLLRPGDLGRSLSADWIGVTVRQWSIATIVNLEISAWTSSKPAHPPGMVLLAVPVTAAGADALLLSKQVGVRPRAGQANTGLRSRVVLEVEGEHERVSSVGDRDCHVGPCPFQLLIDVEGRGWVPDIARVEEQEVVGFVAAVVLPPPNAGLLVSAQVVETRRAIQILVPV